jgi:thiopurine S-methyltransferase
MRPEFRHERWTRNEIGFHRTEPDDLLAAHLGRLGRPGRILVPLCGKSLDMRFLAERGWEVAGVERSPIAVSAFFVEHEPRPDVRLLGAMRRCAAASYTLWCGDFFDLTVAREPRLDCAYDRAALTAIPRCERPRHVAHLIGLLTARARILLVTMEYTRTQMAAPPHSVLEPEVRRLFSGAGVERLVRRDALAREPRFRGRGLISLGEAVYLVTLPGA